jgi:hypothetical protein
MRLVLGLCVRGPVRAKGSNPASPPGLKGLLILKLGTGEKPGT